MSDDNNKPDPNIDINNDIEKGNYEYYLEEHEHTGCWSRFCHEFCQHPFTLLEVNGYVLDVQRTFAAKPSWFIIPIKMAITGVSMDVFCRDLLNYGGVPSFWLAYYENWTTVLTLLYLFMSLFNSLFCLISRQPTAYENRASCGIAVTWCLWVLALSYQFLNFFNYWTLVYYDLDETGIPAVSYFTVMKSFGIFALLVVEGQLMNRIPMRMSHLTISELGLLGYVVWTLLHYASGMGNPDQPNEDGIYWFLNWGPSTLSRTCAGIAVTMLVVLPAIWIVFYVASWPFRRYMPIPVDDLDDEYDYEAMPEHVQCFLEPGSLMAHFDGDDNYPPRVKELGEDSQLHAFGIVPGMVVDTLELGNDGTTFYEMTTSDLVEHLKDSNDQDGRVLTLINPSVRELTPTPGIPDRGVLLEGGEPIEVTLPAGKIGVVLTDQPPVVSRISDESPLVGTGVEVGMWVDTLTVHNDGDDEEEPHVYYELEASELTQLLKDHAESEGRVVRFIPAGMELSKPPGVEALELYLPTGSIGLVFSKATPPEVKAIKDTSPLLDLYPDLKPGMFVDTLTLEDGTTHYHMDGKSFTQLLKDHRDSDARVMRVIRPGMELTDEPSIFPPEEILASVPPGPLMVVLDGHPPVVSMLHEESPLHDFGVVPGMVVDTLELDDGTKHYELSTEELTTLLGDHADDEGRLLRFIDPNVLELTPTPDNTNTNNEEMPPELFCAVPAGPLGADIQGTPPTVQSLADDSCLHEFGVVVGMVVDTLELEDSSKHYEMSAEQLVELLRDNSDSEGRMICFINPELVNLTPTPEKESPDMPLEVEAYLPAGPLGVSFNGSHPVAITELADDSCLHDYEVDVGMVVDTLTLPDGSVHYELELDALMNLLRSHKEEEGKILRLIHPDHLELLTPTPPYEGPDEVTCQVPTGPLGCAFHGAPPVLLNLQDDSPLHTEGVVVGMKVDTVELDGVKHYEMDHLELTSLLKEHADSSDRVLRFVAPHYVCTPPPIPDGIDISDDPEELEIPLPTSQKLGLSFTGTEPICIKTVRPDSELAGYTMEGYGINRIYIPGHTPSEHLVQLNNMKEVMVILTKTKNVSGRVMYLKKPELWPHGFDNAEDYSSPAAQQQLDDDEQECKDSLLEMGFEEDAILSAIAYYRDLGQPVDTDDVMTRIITEGE